MRNHYTEAQREEAGRLLAIEPPIPLKTIEERTGIKINTLKSMRKDAKNDGVHETSSFEQTHDYINVVSASKRITNEKELIEHFGIDTDIWELERYRVKTSEGYRKDRSVEWHIKDGTVLEGDVSDSGKMLVVPLFHIEARFIKKVREAKAKDAVQTLIEDAKKFSPKYPKVNYKKYDDGCLYEIAMPDIHFGRLAWGEETGDDFDINIAQKAVCSVIEQLLSFTGKYNISKILLPIGNDFYNSDNNTDTTTRGTPQQEDTRWQKTFRRGRELAQEMIDSCIAIAPVDILIVPGNHDQQRSFYLGEVLEAWYANNANVKIDNCAAQRKYYQYGKSLIGFAHGYSENVQNLPLVMALEVPDKWAQTTYREWHTGDKHHKKDMVFRANEENGVLVRILRSLAPDDAWTFSKGFKSLKAAEAFLWHPEQGLLAQFTAKPMLEKEQ